MSHRTLHFPKLSVWQYLVFAFGFGSVGIGLKMLTTYLGVWVFFPIFPNILDWVVVIASGFALVFFALAGIGKRQECGCDGQTNQKEQ